ncbi:MAG: YigZ family protein [Kangiellaceae bacterium]|nr:YigZ family protein [Kangiellaceae bacterium]MCW8999560.1 YigZ family protein [Kangiellaceae bacterium]MCW9016374.1 YigZ family protein [Kangiellaceae bacterium]
MPTYLVPAEPVDVEEIIKNSQFITRLRNVASVEAAKGFIKELNQRYPDATHHCWAYIVGDPKATTLLGCSDDGEPSGTAGKPMLNVLQHSHIGDVVAVCTRYYGGTKLGTGGLTRAYGGGVKLAMESIVTKQKIEFKALSFNLDYSQLKDCEHLLKDFQSENYSVDYQTQIIVKIDIAHEQVDTFKQALENKFKGQIEWNTI